MSETLELIYPTDGPPPTDAEAEAALREIGAVITPTSIRALQAIGMWAAKLKMPQIMVARNFTSLEEVARVKEMGSVFHAMGGAKTEDGEVVDAELAQQGCKILTAALQVEERLVRLQLDLHQKSQPEKPQEPQKRALAPINPLHAAAVAST